MNLNNELRMLAEDLHVNGYNGYSAAMSKAADELGSLERYRTAYNEWIAKTEWVQADTTLPAKYLGMHRADVLKGMISESLDRLEAAEKERDDLKAKVKRMEQPAPSVPREAIEEMLTQLMDIAVSNGANSVSMPDEYVEVAAWLCGIPAQPTPSVSTELLDRAIDTIGRFCSDEGWMQSDMATLDALIAAQKTKP